MLLWITFYLKTVASSITNCVLSTMYHFPKERLTPVINLCSFNLFIFLWNYIRKNVLSISRKQSMGYLTVSIDIYFFLHQRFFVLPSLQWRLLQIKLSERETWLLGSQARWRMLPGRKERWAPDYRRKPFFILLESKSSLYTDDKFTNSPRVRFQREIWNFNMFPGSKVNLMTFPQDEVVGLFPPISYSVVRNLFKSAIQADL